MIDSAMTVLCNVPDMAVGKLLANLLLERRLAACVNLVPGVQSLYRWQGAIEQAEEVTLLIKTIASRYAEIEDLIYQNHPYDVPEIIALPVTNGLPAYLAWIMDETRKDTDV